MSKVFISYAHEDYEAAKRLFEELLQIDQDPWLDKESILPGERWEPAISAAIRNCDYFIAVLSQNSIGKRGYVQKELRLGLDVLVQIPESQIFMIPVRVENCDPSYDELRKIQWLDLFPDWDTGIKKLRNIFSFVAPEMHINKEDLSGTRWLGTESPEELGNWIFLLRPDGIVEYQQHDIELEDGRWRIEGSTIYMELNEQYAQYRGTVRHSRMVGEAQNINGDIWTWEAQREA